MAINTPPDLPPSRAVPLNLSQLVTLDQITASGNAAPLPMSGSQTLMVDNRSNVTILVLVTPSGGSTTFPFIVNPQTAEVFTQNVSLDAVTLSRMDQTPLPQPFNTATTIVSQSSPAGFILVSGSSVPAVILQGVGSLPNALPNVLTTLGDLIYAEQGGAATRRAIGTQNQVLTVDGTGRPVWQTPTAYLANPMTTPQDMIVGGTLGAAQRLPVGGNGQYLTVAGGVVQWGNLSGFLVDPTTTTGDLIYRAAGGTTRLGIGATNTVLVVSGGVPVWQSSNYFPEPLLVAGDMLYRNNSSVARLPVGNPNQILSVQAGLPAWYGSNYVPDPLTTAGDMLYKSAVTTTRLPIGGTNQVLTVVAGMPSWATPAAGFADPETTTGDMIYRAAGGTTRLPIGSTNQVLTVVAGVPTWSTPSAGFTDPMTSRGDIIVRNASNVTARLGIGGGSTVLSSDGTDVSWGLRIERGQTSAATVSSGTVATLLASPTFSPAFTTAPIVVTSLDIPSNQPVFVSAQAITTTGFNLYGYQNTGSSVASVVANWIAIGT